MKMKVESDSMLVWFPKIKDLPIPQPKTEILILNETELEKLWREAVPDSLTKKVKAICDRMGYPCFLRTDLASAKHSWKDSCFVDGKTELWKHIYEVTSFNLIADVLGLDFKALIIREYIPMDTKFTAFWGDMPVNPERRYFIKNGEVICHHPYWIEDALGDPSTKPPSILNWREVAKELNTEGEEEIKILTEYSQLVANAIEGFWSIDFCRAKDHKWILIDMATGESSWHPEHKNFIQ